MRITHPLAIVPAIALVAGACAEPDLDAMFTQVDVSAGGRAEAVEAVRALVESAETSLHVALPAGEDTELTDLLVTAAEDGLEVEVTTDFDQVEDAGIVALIEAGIPTTRTNDGLAYYEFVLGTDVSWESADTLLSTSFVVADRNRFVAASELGFVHDGTRIILEGGGEDICDDLLKEHNQLMGNGQDAADATSTTAFDNQAKSIADPRWRYPLQTGNHVEVWFGPQERVTKRIIDAVYTARSNVRVLTDDFANEGLSKALQDKADLGIDVEVVVGPSFDAREDVLNRLFARDTPDVRKLKVDSGRVPTLVIIDAEPDGDPWLYNTRAFVLSHDLYSAERLYRGDPVVTDQLIDSVLFTVEDAVSGQTEPSDEIQVFLDVYQEHRDTAGGL